MSQAETLPTTSPQATPLFDFVLGLADDALVLGHRLSEWCGHGPMLEEDIALANLGLDMIGQARLLYTYAGEVEGRGRDEDKLAFLRDAPEFRNILLVELPKGDFAFTIGRQFLYASFVHPYFATLSGSRDARLAEIAAKAVKEMAYHVRHCGEWVIRLGDGTEESHERMRQAIEELWPFTGEMFEMTDGERRLVAECVAIDRHDLREAWRASIAHVLAKATLEMPRNEWMQGGGRAGRHTEHLGHMLAEMQFLQRAYPGAEW